MINILYPVLLDSSKDLSSNYLTDPNGVFEGSPLSLDATGQVSKTLTNIKVYGLSFVPANKYRDFSAGEYGAFGSGKITAVLSGIVQLYPNTYDLNDGTSVIVPLWVSSVDTAAPNIPIYVEIGTGLLTDGTVSNGNTLVGYVTKSPAMNSGVLELELA